MFESLTYIPTFAEAYSSELAQIESAAEQAAAYVETQRASLTRRDGSAVYAPQEHRDREAAILEKAGADFDAQMARYVTQSEREVADIEKQIALLERDPFDTLTADQQAKAATRREFVREDCERQPIRDLVRQARAVLASEDCASAYLYHRYIQQRLEARQGESTGPDRLALIGVANELAAALGIGDRTQKHRDLERKKNAATALPLALSNARRTFDGSQERMVAAMRQQYGLA